MTNKYALLIGFLFFWVVSFTVHQGVRAENNERHYHSCTNDRSNNDATPSNTFPSPLMVQFPCDVTVECDALEGLEHTGNVVKAGGCGVVGVAYSDQQFMVTEACYKILRTWVVKTWCSWEPDRWEDYTITHIDATQNTITFSEEIDSLILSRNIDIGDRVTLRYVTSETTEIPGLIEGDIYSMIRVGLRTFFVDYNTTKQESVAMTGSGVGPHIFRYANSALGLPVTCETLHSTHPFGLWQAGCCGTGADQRAWQDDGDGYFTFTQVIKVIDNTPPEWISCEDLLFCSNPNDCNPVYISLLGEATDACTPQNQLKYSYQLDLGNDGTIDHQGQTYNASGSYPLGEHKVIFKVTDQCGNWNTCTKRFTITDCIPPTPICINGLSVDLMATPDGGMAQIWAESFESGDSYDHCTPREKLILLVERLSALTPGQTSPGTSASDVLVVDCDDLPPVSMTPYVEVVIWVGDEAGNWDYCTTYIWVQDHMGACPKQGNTLVIGHVQTKGKEGIGNVTFEVSGEVSNAFVSNEMGYASALDIPLGTHIIIKPVKNDDPLNGVSTLDVQRIMDHITGIKKIKNPYEAMAADVDNNGILNLSDALKLRQFILNPEKGFLGNSSWRFVDANYVFTGLNFIGNYPQTMTFSELPHGTMLDFIGVKIGDINGDALPNIFQENTTQGSIGTLHHKATDKEVKKGEIHTMEIMTHGFQGIRGYQYTLNFDPELLEFIEVEPQWMDLSRAHFGLDRVGHGVLTTSWSHAAPVSLEDGDILYTVTFRAKTHVKLSQAIKINSSATPAEAYDEKENLLAVNFQFEKSILSDDTFALFQNEPNPFRDVTIIGFHLPEQTTATLKIYDLTGKVVKVLHGEYARGYNEITLSRADIQGQGMFYYQLDTPMHSGVKRMILVD